MTEALHLLKNFVNMWHHVLSLNHDGGVGAVPQSHMEHSTALNIHSTSTQNTHTHTQHCDCAWILYCWLVILLVIKRLQIIQLLHSLCVIFFLTSLCSTAIVAHVVSTCQDKCQEVNAAISQVTADKQPTMSTSVKLIFSPVNIFSLAASMPLDLA